jgi:hypothetical protein
MEPVLQTLSGFVFLLVLLAIVLSRVLTGRVFPKREIILPNQRGVLVKNDEVVRVAGPGVCWVQPRQRLVLIDARPKPLQMTGVEVLGSDQAVVRLSLSAEYKVSDAAVNYTSSANASDALFVQLRRAINLAARQLSGSALAASPEQFSSRVFRDLAEPAARLGLEIVQMDIYEAVPLGFLRTQAEPRFEFPDTGLVH